MLKKLIFSFLASLIFFFSFVPNLLTVKAASTTPSWYNSSFSEWYGKVYDPNNPSEIFGERYTAAQVQWVVYGLFAFLVNSVTGPENAKLVQCFLNNTININTCIKDLKLLLPTTESKPPVTDNTKNQNLWNLVFATDRPLSGISYVKEKLQNFNIIPVAHAQTVGFGFTALEPIQSMWRAVRDISYGLFVIAAIVLAFMIMFRVKISPQVVISVQSAIPKMIIALILVTFSYAISGFLIDLMYVVIGLISLFFGSMGGVIAGTPAQVFMILTQGQAFFSAINWGVLGLGVLYIIAFLVGFLLLLLYHIGLIGAFAAGAAIGAIGVLLGPLLSFLPLIAILLAILLLVVVVWSFIKTIFSLLKAFANIILFTIFAPLQITAGVVIPNFGFSSWIKSYISSLAVFVVTGVLLFFSFVFLGEGWSIGFSELVKGSQLGNTLLQAVLGVGFASEVNPAISSAAWPPLLGGGNSASGTGLLLMGVSLILFTLIPKANEIVQAAISGKPFAFGAAIGEAARPITYTYEQIMRAQGQPIIQHIQDRFPKLKGPPSAPVVKD